MSKATGRSQQRWALELFCAAAAAAVFVALGPRSAWPDPLDLLLFAGLLVLVENSAVLLPSKTAVSPSFVLVMAAITAYDRDTVVLGAALTGFFGGISLELFRARHLRTLTFNCAQFALAATAAASAFQATGHAVASPVPPVLAAAAAYAAVNLALVLLHVVTATGERPGEVWADMYPALPNYLAFGLMGTLVGGLYAGLGPLAVALLVTPLVIARSTFVAFLQLQEAQEATISVFLRAIRAKDDYTAAHTERVARYSVYIGEELGFSFARLAHLRQSALMHDIGKLAVPKHLLNKPGQLTEDEFRLVRRHAHVCIDLLNLVDFLRPMTAAAAGHHTRYDGGGYGGTGQESKEAFIVTVADAYDAMTSTRAYRRALPMEVAFAELRAKAGTQFDPACVEGLIHAIETRGEHHGAGYEDVVVAYDVEPPAVGVGSAGLGDVLAVPRAAEG